MLDDRIERALGDYESIAGRRLDKELAALEAAIFVEECLDITLSDEEISEDELGGVAAMRALLSRKVGS